MREKFTMSQVKPVSEKYDYNDLDLKTPKAYGWGIRHVQITCMCIIMSALFIARSSMSVALLAMTDSKRNDTDITTYNWNKQIQGLILASFFWGYLIMQIPAGLLAKKFGGKPILLLALLANGFILASQPSLAHWGGWKLLCASRVGMGLTQACLYPASHTLIGRWLPANERTTLSGIVYGGTQLGTIIGMPAAGFLASTSIGWKLVFYSISGLMFLMAIIWYFFAASTPAEHRLINIKERNYIEAGLNIESEKSITVPWKKILTNRGMWATQVAHIGSTCAFVLFFVDMPTYLERGLGISLTASATLSALPYIGMWIGSICASTIFDKIHNRDLLSVLKCRKIFNSISFFGVSVGLVVLSFLGPDSRKYAIMVLILSLTVLGANSAGFMMNHLDLSPNFAGVMFSISNFISNFASIFLPVVTSAILRNDATDVSRWRIVFLIVAAVVSTCNIVYLIFGQTERAEWDDPNFLEKMKADPEELKPALQLEPVKEDKTPNE